MGFSSNAPTVQLAALADAGEIASISRDQIEHGLGWAWTVGRVQHSIRDADTNEAVAQSSGVTRIDVECRRDNAGGRNFYGEHGYHEHVIARGYYRGIEDAARLEKWLVP